jgi:hypothetical protein
MLLFICFVLLSSIYKENFVYASFSNDLTFPVSCSSLLEKAVDVDKTKLGISVISGHLDISVDDFVELFLIDNAPLSHQKYFTIFFLFNLI